MPKNEPADARIAPKLDKVKLSCFAPAAVTQDISFETLDEAIIKAGVKDPDFLLELSGSLYPSSSVFNSTYSEFHLRKGRQRWNIHHLD
jgi:hypothetical protein